ncbi:hypothetical protein CHS0354_023500 [Potamilus streckersoni]|uniref:Uncharacterized protein n=1 Tax=Potamilus streckersoni TaxID=2493646 RepID=A0AAE0RVI2_9BIVA|nr:hypothetical protein CHS0354_023500 [Potamilus streckersoni]
MENMDPEHLRPLDPAIYRKLSYQATNVSLHGLGHVAQNPTALAVLRTMALGRSRVAVPIMRGSQTSFYLMSSWDFIPKIGDGSGVLRVKVPGATMMAQTGSGVPSSLASEDHLDLLENMPEVECNKGKTPQITEGMICVAHIDGLYHRVKVLSIEDREPGCHPPHQKPLQKRCMCCIAFAVPSDIENLMCHYGNY